MRREFRITRHAAERLVEMGVGPDEVSACLYRPEAVWASPKYVGRLCRRAGRLTLAIGEDGCSVVTALWSDADGWRDDLVGRGGVTDRKFRGGC